jgi:hypothetical protein
VLLLAKICVNYRQIYFGPFHAVDEAGRAYDEAAKKPQSLLHADLCLVFKTPTRGEGLLGGLPLGLDGFSGCR